MLEWKTRVLTLLITFAVVAEELQLILRNNWNW
jgi:hypothetical protein